ncbi:MAG: N-acetylmuramoyl-L-alanine amidase [Alphaproteobacteria bacterium]|nr:N-acetylmuramoyl-L-alanine amidase [Alphaproteobacteria bacterium]
MKILINPGHSIEGLDHGAIGKSGLWEAKANANIALLVKRYLDRKGVDCVIFQQKKSLTEVIKYENANDFDLAVSIHCNAATSAQANGVETLYYPSSQKSKKLAEYIQDELVKVTELRDRGIKKRSDLAFLEQTKTIAVLVECAFISNRREEQMLKNDDELFARGIANGIIRYIQ